jgi:hypothetical protein
MSLVARKIRKTAAVPICIYTARLRALESVGRACRYRRYVRAVYQQTQAWLAAHQITRVLV